MVNPGRYKEIEKELNQIGKRASDFKFRKEDMRREVCAPILRLLWRKFLEPSLNIADKINDANYRVVAKYIHPYFNIHVTKEELHESLLIYAKNELVRDQDIDWMPFRDAVSFEDFIKNVFWDRSPDPEYVNLFLVAWDQLRPRIAKLSTNLVTSVKEVYTEYILWLKKHPEVIDQMAWEAFEKMVAEILSSRGFIVDLTGRVRNQSADLIAIRVDELGVETKYLIECKRYARTRRIGLDIVNAVIGAARRADVDHSLLVTSSLFTEDVKRQENRLRDCRLHLRDGDDVVSWLSDYTPREEGGLWLPTDWNRSMYQLDQLQPNASADK
ncbi:hypothetical protein DSCW_19720 [Desulfosarcina widdelii]|uniref:Restriction endonuclease type IV Mrr domain-containing protein n=1 Tax=Desulfosarcina widdelii TaxID=947919 RepID=A0A5K7Z1G5_9BACT|nr:restriction endonuclease [Desulfosarcina widdelii]BBO74555.1 hypothetical protein DSCW_19720 [Desulfosarcina widdelii]